MLRPLPMQTTTISDGQSSKVRIQQFGPFDYKFKALPHNHAVAAGLPRLLTRAQNAQPLADCISGHFTDCSSRVRLFVEVEFHSAREATAAIADM